MLKPMTTKQFFDLARKRTPRTAAKIDAAIHKACAAELTVVCCDSAGFSRKTHEHGIIEFMDNMVKCHDGLEKIVHRMGGVTLSNKADNLMLTFPEPGPAVACAIEMHRWLKRRNKPLPDFKKYNICVGIHHGKLLRFADDAYGAAVNVAFKLGEDVAGKDELIVSGQVNDLIKKDFRTDYSKHVTIGGTTFDVYRVKYR
ncbi:MAG: adenylate/guanylate cyclase domain-containing protein [Elusimicrobiales bacterium]|nr:adenylate/guanylate cyclase domain-containing protein [Elusimicrobiales bacterium]